MKSIFIFVFISFLFILSPFSVQAVDFQIELLDASRDYQRVESFPYGVNYEIVVASQTQDVRLYLPITVKVRSGKKQFTNTIPNNPEQNCRGADGCSLPGPMIAESQRGEPLEILALDKNSQELAYFSENLPSGAASLRNNTVSSPTPAVQLSPTTIPSMSPVASTLAPKTSPFGTVPPSSSPQPKSTPIDQKNLGGGALVAAGLTLLWWELTSKKPKQSKPCPHNCKLGECTVSVNKATTSTFGLTPKEEKDVFDGLDLTGYLKFGPKPGLGGFSAGGAGVDIALAKAKKFLEDELKKTRKFSGVNLYATVIWSRCIEIHCTSDQKGTDWGMEEETEIQIPPGKFSHDLNAKGWKEEKLLNPKYQEAIRNHIDKYLREHGPGYCKVVYNV